MNYELIITEEELSEDREKDITKACESRYFTLEQLAEGYTHPLAYREVLHLSYVQQEMVDTYLVEHPSILLDEEAYHHARAASEALFNLYQRLGQIEYEADHEDKD